MMGHYIPAVFNVIRLALIFQWVVICQSPPPWEALAVLAGSGGLVSICGGGAPQGLFKVLAGVGPAAIFDDIIFCSAYVNC